MSEKTPTEIVVKTIEKDCKDDKHYYDFEMGKKFYRWKVTTETGELIYVRKLEEHGAQPYNPGDRLKGNLEVKEKDGRKRTVLSKIEVVGADGKPVAQMGKSTYNDPNVTLPKMKAKALGAAIRVVLKLRDWDKEATKEAQKDDPEAVVNQFHVDKVGVAALHSMRDVFFTFITDDGKDTNRDSMDLRLEYLHHAITCMELPAFTSLKGNDEDPPDAATGKPVIKKKLSVKLVEQADAYYTEGK